MGQADYMEITENDCHDNAGQGIVHNLAGAWQVISNNHSYRNGTSETDGGLYIGGSHDCMVIENNRIHHNNVGFRLASGAVLTNSVFRGNLNRDNDIEEMSGATLTATVTQLPVVAVDTSDESVQVCDQTVLVNPDGVHVGNAEGMTLVASSGQGCQKQIVVGQAVPESLGEGEVFVLV